MNNRLRDRFREGAGSVFKISLSQCHNHFGQRKCRFRTFSKDSQSLGFHLRFFNSSHFAEIRRSSGQLGVHSGLPWPHRGSACGAATHWPLDAERSLVQRRKTERPLVQSENADR